MQINLPNSGTFFFISDHCHVIENVSEMDPGGGRQEIEADEEQWRDGVPQGWLARYDFHAT